MQCFKSQGQAKRFVATHGAIYNLFNFQRHFISQSSLRRFRVTAIKDWIIMCEESAKNSGPESLATASNNLTTEATLISGPAVSSPP